MKDHIEDFCSSERFLFLDSALKPHAEAVLLDFCENAGDTITRGDIDAGVDRMSHLDLPVEVRKALPALLDGFFSYVNETGRVPGAEALAQHAASLAPAHEGRFRDDGTVRGETFAKNYTDVGRNDPCPCGSTKKFKKCCMKLIR